MNTSYNNKLFADIAFNLPFYSTFTYEVPYSLSSNIKVGMRVQVSFLRDQKKMGVVIKLHSQRPNFELKLIQKIYDDFFILPVYAYYIAQFISQYYSAPLSECLHLFIPDGILNDKEIDLIKNEEKKDDNQKIFSLSLNQEQENIVLNVQKLSKNFAIFHTGLIFGITGSGKTQVYQQLAYLVIQQKKQVLILLPEIALTVQIIDRFTELFDRQSIAVIHSKMSKKEKLITYYKISTGIVQLIIGPRSALFSPFYQLGLIIMDEEHDFSYKSHSSPRYHTRQVAYKLAENLQATFILGSATPSIETFYAASQKKITLYELKKRFYHVNLPSTELVSHDYRSGLFSQELVKAILETKKLNQQSLIFLNRRGYSPLIVCTSCGYIEQCPYCSIQLTYHKSSNELHCHYCSYKKEFQNQCHICQTSTLKIKSGGTERLQEEIENSFKHLRIIRMDKDTMKKQQSLQEAIQLFTNQEADILIGTQMIVKGFDFPGVTLACIISCDTILNIPDFRSAENVFNLITQIAGRSGRKESGKVILQTQYKEHYSIQYSLNQDYIGFFQKEIEYRKKYLYPPFIHLIRFIIRAQKKEIGEKKINKLYESLKQELPDIIIIGPSPCFIEKISNQYRYHLIMKVKNPMTYHYTIKTLLKKMNNKAGYHIECDVNPITLM